MKIDLHCHTKKIKQGDPETRNVDPTKFADAIINAGVGIVAITNHNYFNLEEFNAFCRAIPAAGGSALVLPGVELDVTDDKGSRGHVILVADDKEKDEFNQLINKLNGINNPNSFNCSVDDLIKLANSINCIVIAHSDDKTPHLSDESLDKIRDSLNNNYRFFRETSNLQSVCVKLYHHQRYILGSDIQDWDKYSSEELPEIKIDINTFDGLMHFIKRDEEVIKSLLKNYDEYKDIDVSYGKNASKENITLYRGINIIFGDKATGKTCCLNKIEEYFQKHGKKISKFDPRTVDETIEDLKTADKNQKVLEYYEQDNLENECNTIFGWTEAGVTQLKDFMLQYENITKNKNREKIKITDINNELISNSDIKTHCTNFNKICSIENDLRNINPQSYLSDDEFSSLSNDLQLLKRKIADAYFNAFVSEKSIQFANDTIEYIRDIVTGKTGGSYSPLKTGLIEFTKNRLTLYDAVRQVNDLFNFNSQIEQSTISINDDKKLKVYLSASMITDKTTNDKSFNHVTLAKNLRKKLEDLNKNLLDGEKIKADISEIKGYFNEDKSKVQFNMDLFLGARNEFYDQEGSPYEPSSGERVLIALNEKLNEEADVYLLDEPDSSLGNSYVNEYLIPPLQRLENKKKLVVVVTHNANIAIRTMPYCSILKTRDGNDYHTYLGSPYYKEMTNVCDPKDKKDWKEESIKLLEGGKDAFEERGDIYDIR